MPSNLILLKFKFKSLNFEGTPGKDSPGGDAWRSGSGNGGEKSLKGGETQSHQVLLWHVSTSASPWRDGGGHFLVGSHHTMTRQNQVLSEASRLCDSKALR
jgi:hypothetical protein